jgi:hypothetical protein
MTKEHEEQNMTFNLEDEKDVKELETELKGDYFNPENDITYKVILNSPVIIPVIKEFDNGPITKYSVDATISDKNGEVFKGLWEVGATVIKVIAKNYEKDAVFKITKTGEGLKTRYSVVCDF